MPAAASALLIAELEGAVLSGSPERRVRMLRQVTDLFLSDANRLNENQIGVFDDVLVRLIERMEACELLQLSSTLSGCDSAPKEIVRQLAHHEEASVAGPVLTKSIRISEDDLIRIAKSHGQKHLLAISGRAVLNENVTEILLERGDQGVSRKLAANGGARFSDIGYSTLAERAAGDGTLAETLGFRGDLPEKTLRDLLPKASEATRIRLLKHAPPKLRVRIQAAIRAVVEQVAVKTPELIDYTEALNSSVALNRAGKLGDQAINRFASQGEYPNIVAALSLLSTASTEAIEQVMGHPRLDGLMIVCKASRLNWSTTAMIIRNRPNCAPVSKAELAQARQRFESLLLSAAQLAISFWPKKGAVNVAVAESEIATTEA
jgi:hypothetical protein